MSRGNPPVSIRQVPLVEPGSLRLLDVGLQVLVFLTRGSARGTEVLLLHRVPERFPIWQGVTGRVEEGERLLSAARREVEEETGAIGVGDLRSLNHVHSFSLEGRFREFYPGCRAVEEHLFTGSLPARFEPRLDRREHDDWRFADLREAEALLHWPSNREALRLLPAARAR